MANDRPRDFVTTQLLGSGWAAVHFWWNSEEDFLEPGEGFWEPWNTGMGRYATEAEAVAEAASWAESDGLRYVPRGSKP